MRKLFRRHVFAVLPLLVGLPASGQTLDWGSPVFTDIVDSQGNPIDSMFVIEIGAFVDGFTPDEDNVDEWLANWRIFDRATYNPTLMYFTSVASMNDDGSSTSAHSTSGFSFEGLDAFLWIRKGDDPVEGTEWLLTRSVSSDPAKNWEFPNAVPGCCDNQGNLQWSISDLDSGDIPVWGSQGGVPGSGVFTITGPYALQTYTFVPEPSSLVLAAFSAGILLRRRRRA
jgi:hypothetical protein